MAVFWRDPRKATQAILLCPSEETAPSLTSKFRLLDAARFSEIRVSWEKSIFFLVSV